MIITRSPLRISLGGGGTDLPSYYENHEGFLIAGAIDKYVYINLHHTFQQEIIIKYSKMQRVKSVAEVEHPIIKEALTMLKFDHEPHIEIASMADIPAGTGLGSSGSFTTALLKALYTYKKEVITAEALARQACEIEIDRLHEPIGKQDQYIAAYGGLTCFYFLKDGRVVTEPLRINEETLFSLEDNLLLFYTGITRSASEVLKDQKDKSQKNDSEMIENLHFTKELGLQTRKALENGDLKLFAKQMDEHWQRKRKRSKQISSGFLDECYDFALKNGALGGKLIGAGGGGFLMFYAEDKLKLRHALRERGLREVRFRFDFEGSKAVIQ